MGRTVAARVPFSQEVLRPQLLITHSRIGVPASRPAARVDEPHRRRATPCSVITVRAEQTRSRTGQRLTQSVVSWFMPEQ